MTDTDMDTDTVTGTDISGIYDSCADFRDAAKTDEYWCWDTQENDYSQIWTIMGFVYIMLAAQFVLIYTSFINRFMAMRAYKIPIRSSESVIPIPIIIYHNDEPTDFVTLLAHVAVHIIYIFIRISLLMSNHVNTVNHQFASMEFQQFMNARNFLLIIILSLHPFGFVINYVVWRRKYNGRMRKLILLGYILLVLDAVFILIAFCVYYSLLVGMLYLVAIGLLTELISYCILICFSALFTAIFVKCCVNGQCIQLTEDDIGDVVIEFPGFVTQFAVITLKLLILIAFFFGVGAFGLFFVWYFLGGPPHAVFYTDFTQYEDDMIYWLFIFATVVAIAALLWELITLSITYYNRDRNQRGVHREIDSNDSDN